MKGSMQKGAVGRREYLIYLPPSYESEPERRYPVVYAGDGGEVEEMLAEIMDRVEPRFADGSCREFLLVALYSGDPDGEYSPWPAPAVFQENSEFGGRAREYLGELEGALKPEIDRRYRTRPEDAALMGYSLAGLCALFGMYHTTCFRAFASLSGSLWYEGWPEFVERTPLPCPEARVYLSLGRKERKSRNRTMARVGDWTEQTCQLLRGRLTDPERLFFTWHDGGHFTDVPGRIASALLWLEAAGD